LIGIMLVVAISVGALAFQAMYRLSMQEREQGLLNLARSCAALLDATVDGGSPNDTPVATRLQPLFPLQELGRTGELVITRLHDNAVERLTLRGGAGQMAVERNVWSYERLGEPSRAALAGRTGTMVAKDHRGVDVLTAFTRLDRVGFGIVLKVDMDEVRAPMLRTASRVALVAIFLMEIAALAIIRLMNPVLRRLEESEARLRGIINGAAEGIISIGGDGLVSSLNPAATRMFGWQNGPMTGVPLRTLFPDDADFLEKCATSGLAPETFRLSGCRADGTRIPLELSVSAALGGGGARFTGVVRDLTDQRAAEQVLRSANEILEQRVEERTVSLFRTNQLLRATGEVQSMFLERDQLHAYGHMLDRLLVLAGAASGLVARWAGGERAVTLAVSAGADGWSQAEIQAMVRAVAATGGVVHQPSDESPSDTPFLGIPLVHGDTPVGIVGLRGCSGCDQERLAYLEPFLRACAHLLYEAQREREREQERDKQLAYRRELNSILLNVQDIILRFDLRGTVLWVSPSVATVAGYTTQELLGRNGSELFANYADFYRFLTTLERGYGRVRDFEILLRRHDGSVFWGSANAHYFGDGESGAAGIEGVIRDITSYKRAEQRVEALNRLYTVLSEANKAIVRQRDHLPLYESVCRILVEHGHFCMAWIGEVDEAGNTISPVGFAGKSDGYLDGFSIHLDDPLQKNGPTATAIRQGVPVIVGDIANDERVAVWRDQALERGFRSSAAFPLSDEGRAFGALNVYAGDPDYFNEEHVQLLLSLVADLAYAVERLRVERQNREMVEDLRRINEKLTHHMENTPLAVIEYDESFTVQHWNVAAEAMFGIPSRSAIGASGTIIIPLAQQSRAKRAFKRLLNQNGGWASMNENVTADGRAITCEWYNTPLTDGEGRVTGVISVGHDITEIVHSRNEILALNATLEQRVDERTRELAAVNKELESFSYSVSHDLRAPLRSIDGFSDLVLRRYGDALDETGHDYLRRVRRAARRMSELIDALLELSRVTSCALERGDVDVSGLAAEIVEELRHAQPEHQVEAMIQPGLRAWADGRLFRIVLVNLLGNAWKFTRHRDRARIEVGMEFQCGEPVFVVRDNGAGFDMAYAGKLFGAFQRLHSAEEFDGTGIGLATVQRVINRHGGRIWATAEVNVGAVFHFSVGASRDTQVESLGRKALDAS
jgi:PAS domain S-box-containing protein